MGASLIRRTSASGLSPSVREQIYDHLMAIRNLHSGHAKAGLLDSILDSYGEEAEIFDDDDDADKG